MVFEGGLANMPRDENKTLLQQMNIATILPAVLMLIAYLLLQPLIQSKDPDNRWVANGYLFLCGITLSSVLLAMLNNLSTLWTWKYTYSSPESKVEGKVSFNRWHIYKVEAHKAFFQHAVLFFILYLITGSAFLMGGSLVGFALAFRFTRYAKAIANTSRTTRRSRTKKPKPGE